MARTAQELGDACAAALWAEDEASRALGMTLDRVGPGQSSLSMTVTKAFCNGHGTCHGGFIFTLADSAFAFACNSYNRKVVAQQAAVTFIAPAFAEERLTAEAVEVARYGRNGIYDVTVSKADGSLVASFRGQSREIKGSHLPDEAE